MSYPVWAEGLGKYDKTNKKENSKNTDSLSKAGVYKICCQNYIKEKQAEI